MRNIWRYLSIVLALALLIGIGYWVYAKSGLFESGVPSRPPTAEERARMEEIEQSANTVAPDAVPGAGVRPRGSLPPQPAPALEGATSTPQEEPGRTSADPEISPVEELP